MKIMFVFYSKLDLMVAANFEKGEQRRAALQALLEPNLLEWTRIWGNPIDREAFLQQLLTGETR
ncbi:precorrin-2 dehydrogenase OS=Lysinibacillus sphaericus OX=1421 GN=LS41612_09500 PE=4 SV=1 [Lysinibacillus sphaericus]